MKDCRTRGRSALRRSGGSVSIMRAMPKAKGPMGGWRITRRKCPAMNPMKIRLSTNETTRAMDFQRFIVVSLALRRQSLPLLRRFLTTPSPLNLW